jgi:hypothetical protein
MPFQNDVQSRVAVGWLPNLDNVSIHTIHTESSDTFHNTTNLLGGPALDSRPEYSRARNWHKAHWHWLIRGPLVTALATKEVAYIRPYQFTQF